MRWFRICAQDVPVLVIARDPIELEQIYGALKKRLLVQVDEKGESKGGKLLPEDLQQLRQLDASGNSLEAEWGEVIERATLRNGTGAETYCVVTVTEYFGGRGHDFSVMDDMTDANGGMLVIATSVPDKREWIQWKGRTARQDKPGQYEVVLHKKDECFKGYKAARFKEFESLSSDQQIERL